MFSLKSSKLSEFCEAIPNKVLFSSLSLILNNDDSDYLTNETANAETGWATKGITGDCIADDGTNSTVLTGLSETGTQWTITFVGSTPGSVEEVL